jgi:hypothetical protein
MIIRTDANGVAQTPAGPIGGLLPDSNYEFEVQFIDRGTPDIAEATFWTRDYDSPIDAWMPL